MGFFREMIIGIARGTINSLSISQFDIQKEKVHKKQAEVDRRNNEGEKAGDMLVQKGLMEGYEDWQWEDIDTGEIVPRYLTVRQESDAILFVATDTILPGDIAYIGIDDKKSLKLAIELYSRFYEGSKVRVVLEGHLSSMIEWRVKESLTSQNEYKDEIFLYKECKLHKGKLVRKKIPIKGKGGKIFYHMQWLPSVNSLDIQHGDKEDSTYAHHENGLKEMEHRQNNKFPVIRVPIEQVRVDSYGYKPDEAAISDAIGKYNEGEKLPPVRIYTDGKIVCNEVMYEMAKQLGLSHIPAVIVGNIDLKKKLETKYREQTLVEDEDEDGNKVFIPIGSAGLGVDFKSKQTE